MDTLWEQRRQSSPYQSPKFSHQYEAPFLVPSFLLLGHWNVSHMETYPTNELSCTLYGDRYLFEKDGTYPFSESIASELPRRYTWGNWWIESDILYLSAVKILEFHGDHETRVDSFDLQTTEELLTNGDYTYIFRSEEERQVSSFSVTIDTDAQGFVRSITMGDFTLWNEPIFIFDMLSFRDYHS